MEMYLKIMLFDMLLRYLRFLVETDQATVEVYIIQSSRERYFIIVLN